MPFTFDTSQLENAVRDLATLAGHGSNAEQALYVVAGKVLDRAIAHTPMASPDALIERVNLDVNLDFASYDLVSGDGVLTTNQGRRGNLPAGTQWLHEGGKNYIMRGGNPRRWSNARWSRYQATAAQRQADLDQSLRIRQRKALASIGLTRQSWVQCADALGITLHAPKLGMIRSAVASDGRQYQNGTGYRDDTEDGIALVLENSMPILVRGDGAGILQRAMNAEAAAFETAVKNGLFLDLQAVARRYRGLDVQLL